MRPSRLFVLTMLVLCAPHRANAIECGPRCLPEWCRDDGVCVTCWDDEDCFNEGDTAYLPCNEGSCGGCESTADCGAGGRCCWEWGTVDPGSGMRGVCEGFLDETPPDCCVESDCINSCHTCNNHHCVPKEGGMCCQSGFWFEEEGYCCLGEENGCGPGLQCCDFGHPFAGFCDTCCGSEMCDGIDNDCDGEIDEGFSTVEICNGVNDNCNDQIDEGCYEESDPPEDECSPLMVFDPVNIATGQSFLRRRDFAVSTTAGLVAFERTYSPRGETPDSFRLPDGTYPLASTPMPFGANPSGGQNMLWWHNFYSFVLETAGAGTIVFAPNGRMYRFLGCSPAQGGSCWASNAAGGEAVRHRLRIEETIQGLRTYALFMDDGLSYRYSARYENPGSPTKTFLSQVTNDRAELLATLNYSVPSVAGCTNAGAGGVPYIDSIEFANGAVANFDYIDNQCVLSDVTLAGATIVGFSYLDDEPGLLEAIAGQRVESYSYYDNTFGFELGDQSGGHTLDRESGRVAGINAGAGIGDVSLYYGTDGATNSASFSIPPPYFEDPPISDPTVTRTYSVAPADGHQSYRVSAITESCTEAPEVCQQGTTLLLLGTTSQITYERGARDPSGGYSIQEKSPSTSQFPSLLETTTVYKGASVDNGSDALEVQRYEYSYDSAGRQRVERHYRDSLYGGVTDAQFDYDSNNRIVKVTQYGKTKTLWDTIPRNRWIVTFYRYSTGTPCAPVAAGYEWKETRGPCIFDSDPSTKTDCPAGSSFPVVQEVYYPNSAPAPKRGQLFKRVSFPSGCDQTATLVTTFLNYDEFGNALSIEDPNGVVTAYTWDGPARRMKSKTIGTKVWQYEYDNGELLFTKYPEGNYEVYCHRVGGTSGCDLAGEWSPNLQWKAKAGDAFAASFAEKVVYSYRSDGTVDTESYLAADGSIRRVKRFAADAHGNIIREGLGTPDAANRSPVEYVRDYDHAGMRRFGRPYVNDEDDTPYCDDLNKNCSKLSYDLARRVKSVVEYPDSVSPTKQLFEYDAHGNVASVLTGCNESDTYTDCELAGKPESLYEYDDFGNLVRISLPFLGASGGGVVRKEYNAFGLVTRQDSEKLRALATKEWLEYSYDQLGRLLTASRVEGDASGNESSRELLYTHQYDFALSDGACLPLTNVKGRLRRTIDSFGTTWFSYDSEGRITNENRLRVGGVCSGPIDDHPSTQYTYRANGNIDTIVYPHGSTVYYLYGEGGKKDRVAGVNLAPVGGTTMAVVDEVRWEPYGGIRDYRIIGVGIDGQVKYLAGSADLAVPNECDIKESNGIFANTGTGLLKSLWVTRNGKSGAESLLKHSYVWRGDQVQETKTCVLESSGVPKTHSYGYDQIGRLTSVAAERTYPLDGRGRRISGSSSPFVTEGSASFYYRYDQTDALSDRLLERRQFVGTPGDVGDLGYNGRNYSWDIDGRVSSITNAPYALSFNFSVDGQVAGRDSVFRSVNVSRGPSNGYVNYFYDSRGRRRLKVYPLNGVSDEYFYSFSSQMLEDRGNVSGVTSADGYLLDQYIWLDGRPIAMFKSRFSDTWVPTQDFCPRNGEAAECGLYFIVTDHLSKPVMMLNFRLNVVGVADYDPFGYPNRQPVNGQVQNPQQPNSRELFGVCETANLSKLESQDVRVRFSFFDVNLLKYFGDRVLLEADGVVLGSQSGLNRGVVVTPWVRPGKDVLEVYYVTDKDTNNGDGAAIESCELRRYEAGVKYPVWTPIRFPGQYHDEETDLFENWNRYYDPSIGRYLQPEPLMQNPRATASYARAGIQINPYGYAASNPLRYYDFDGLRPGDPLTQDIREKYVGSPYVPGGVEVAVGAASGAILAGMLVGPEILLVLAPTASRWGDAAENAWIRFNASAYNASANMCQNVRSNYFRGPEYSRWKEAGQWTEGWHVHANPGLSPSLMQHHLPQQLHSWLPHFAAKLEAWIWSLPPLPPL